MNNIPQPQILIHQFLQTMRMRNCSERTIHSWRFVLKRFVSWCHERSLDCMSDITADHLAAYRRSLFHYRNPANRPSAQVRDAGALPDSASPLVLLAAGKYLH